MLSIVTRGRTSANSQFTGVPPTSRIRVSSVTPKRATNSCMRRARKRRMTPATMVRGEILTLGFLDLFDQRRNHFEQATHASVIRHFEDGRVGILVDGDDGFGALH